MATSRSAALASARALLARGDAAAAVSLLEAALREHPCWGRGWLLLGQCHARAGAHDAAAVSFARAAADACDDASPTLTLVATENAQLCASRFLPRHTLAWLNDAARAGAWRDALQRALGGCPGGCSVLCGGGTAAASVLHAALSLQAGATRATAVCGSELVAGLVTGLDARLTLLAALPAPAAPLASSPAPAAPALHDVLVWDFGNRLDAASLDALCVARGACVPQPAVLPACVRVRAAVVECEALLEVNSLERVAVTQRDVAAAGGAAGPDGEVVAAFEFAHFAAAYTRAVRPVQLQAASQRPWRVLTGAARHGTPPTRVAVCLPLR
jgi:hypothetical protein